MSTHGETALNSASAAHVDWPDWQTQLRQSICTVEQLQELIEVTSDEMEAIKACEKKYRWAITPYYASLMDRLDPNCPIRRQAIPNLLEFRQYPGSDIDPVGDIENRKTNRAIHKYPDRIAMLVSDSCAVYCRHCTRKYHTIDYSGTYYGGSATNRFDEDLEYIERHNEIRDVLLTGGDPLMLIDRTLDQILSAIRHIRHVEIIRIGSRFPVVLPQRISEDLSIMLERYQPLYFVTQFNHPKEITRESIEACNALIKHGTPILNQSVLLRGINDSVAVMRELVVRLLQIKVLPYYLYHCDNSTGVAHFMTSIKEGREIIDGLIGYTTGFAVPRYIITTKIGKIPLSRDYACWDDGRLTLTNYQGKQITIDGIDF